MCDFDFGDMADLAGGLQRQQQIQQQAANNQKLDRITELLEHQRAESLRIAHLPKCPECKSSVEMEARKCPNCKDKLFWCSLPNGLFPIANDRGEKELLRVMHIFIKQVEGCRDQWINLIDLLTGEIMTCIRTIHEFSVVKRSSVLELFESSQKAIEFASDSKKMAPTLTGAIWNGARIDMIKELKIPELLHTTHTLSSRFEDLLIASAEQAKTLLRVCKCRDYDGRVVLRDYAMSNETVGFAINLVQRQQEWIKFFPSPPTTVAACPSYYLLMIQQLLHISQTPSLQAFLKSTKGIRCPKCDNYNHYLKVHFSRGERCIKCDCVIQPKSTAGRETAKKRIPKKLFRVACPKCSTKKDLSLSGLGSRIVCSTCGTAFTTKKPS